MLGAVIHVHTDMYSIVFSIVKAKRKKHNTPAIIKRKVMKVKGCYWRSGRR
jgi:hypothetical protein